MGFEFYVWFVYDTVISAFVAIDTVYLLCGVILNKFALWNLSTLSKIVTLYCVDIEAQLYHSIEIHGYIAYLHIFKD